MLTIAPALAGQHVAQGGPGAVEGPIQVACDLPAPLGVGQTGRGVEKRRRLVFRLGANLPVTSLESLRGLLGRAPGVVDENVDPAELPADLGEAGVDRRRIGDVGYDRNRSRKAARDAGRTLGDDVEDRHAGALLREPATGGLADSRATSGHDCSLSLEKHARPSPLRSAPRRLTCRDLPPVIRSQPGVGRRPKRPVRLSTDRSVHPACRQDRLSRRAVKGRWRAPSRYEPGSRARASGACWSSRAIRPAGVPPVRATP